MNRKLDMRHFKTLLHVHVEAELRSNPPICHLPSVLMKLVMETETTNIILGAGNEKTNSDGPTCACAP